MRRVVCAAWVFVALNVVFGFAFALRLPSALAQDTGLDRAAWIGVKVMPKFDVEVMAEDVAIDETKLSLPWVVQDVNGDSLYVGDHDKGWIKRSEVVTLDEAPAYYTALVVRGEHLAWAYEHRAITWELIGVPELSVFDFEEQLRLEPSARAYSCRGAHWVLRKEYDKAIDDLNRAIRLEPKDAAAYSSRGEAWFYKQQYDKAIADFDQAIRLDPNDARAYDRRGRAWLGKGACDKAIADFTQAIRLDPNDAGFYRNRGNVWMFKQQYAKASADFEQAISKMSTGCRFVR